jgi:hypothetical protein
LNRPEKHRLVQLKEGSEGHFLAAHLEKPEFGVLELRSGTPHQSFPKLSVEVHVYFAGAIADTGLEVKNGYKGLEKLVALKTFIHGNFLLVALKLRLGLVVVLLAGLELVWCVLRLSEEPLLVWKPGQTLGTALVEGRLLQADP